MRYVALCLLSSLTGCGGEGPTASPSGVASSVALPSADEAMARARRDERPEPVPVLPTKGIPARVLDRDAACRGGDGDACVELAWHVEDLSLTRAPVRLAADILRRSCDRGHAPSCAEYGEHLLDGRGIPQDVEAGAAKLETACAAGVQDGCGRLGLELVRGRLLRWDRRRGLGLLAGACEASNYRACGVLERRPWVARYSKDPPAEDEPTASHRAVDVAREACLAGKVAACAQIDEWQFAEIDTRKFCAAGVYAACLLSNQEAMAEKACIEGYPRACSMRYPEREAELCARGIGSACTFETPAASIRAGCKAGAARACRGLRLAASADDRSAVAAEACELGDDIACADVEARRGPPFTPERVAVLAKGCIDTAVDEQEPGVAVAACTALGKVYREGAGMAKDPGRALEYFRRACWGRGRYADDDGCVAFGDMLRDGEGVTAEPARALIAYISSCSALESDKAVACARVKAMNPAMAPQ